MAQHPTREESRQLADADANRDPLTGAPGAHPVGVGIGAAAGGMAVGAAVGTVAGPVGTAVGAALGAIAGGLVGKGAAEAIDPTAEGAWWRDHYAGRDYVDPDYSFADYGPAYVYAVEIYTRAGDRDFDEAEPELAGGWDDARNGSRLAWDEARSASRDAWDRARERTRGLRAGR